MRNARSSRTRRSRARAGFSLAELLVAIVLLGIVAGALTRLLVDQMRFFDGVQVARGARSAARNSMNVMFSELRMVHDSGGITAVGGDNRSITVRVPYRFGVFCGTSGGASTVSMLPADSAVLAGASYFGYGYRNTNGRYTIGGSAANQPSSPGTAANCTAAFINTLTFNGRSGGTYDLTPAFATTPSLGAPVMFFQEVTYSFQNSTLFPGKMGLFRSVNGGAAEELVAPFTSTARFRYYKSGDDTSRTTAPALSDIRGVAIELYAEGARRPAGRTTDAQSRMMTSIFFKNTRAP